MLKSKKQKRKKKHLKAYERRLIARFAVVYFSILVIVTIAMIILL